jgi:DNA-3-methyladenine glycosylase
MMIRMPEADWSVLAGPPDVAARALLGCRLRANGVTVRLTEVEAYGGVGEDPASHSHRGPTPRNTVMFGRSGVLYVYFVFGMHWCLNVVTGPPGSASAVLLRAAEVVEGHDLARVRRAGPGVPRDRDLARGPARLAVALDIDGAATGTSLLDGTGPVQLLPALSPERAPIASGPRVGVALAADVPWRFWLDGDPSVSAYRRHVPRRQPSGGQGSQTATQ